MSELLQKLASYHGIPVGVDNFGNREEKCRLNERMELTETDGTLRDLLNRITEKSTNCKFEVVDEVLNVYSSNGWSFIADQKLARIKIEHGNGKNEIKSKIIKDKNLQSLLKRENKRLTFFVTSLGDYRPVSKDFSFQGEGLSVREILNKIIKSGSSRYWVLTTVDDQNDTVYLNF
ncbi:MAG: hypothetical protein R2681_03705 [Pyrinomonadaceae bacterium]